MALRSDLGHVRGLGSAKDGTSHWWAQRITAVALLPLSIWLVFSLISLVGVDRDGFKVWLDSPGSFVLMILFLIALFYHMQLGLQVVIEDYVHSKGSLLFLIIFNKLFCWTVGLAGVFAILKITFAG